MNTKIFVLSMDGCDSQVVLAQSKKELAYRLYGMKIEKPAQQLFMDPKAKIVEVATITNDGVSVVDTEINSNKSSWLVNDLVNYACALMKDRDVEVLPNE